LVYKSEIGKIVVLSNRKKFTSDEVKRVHIRVDHSYGYMRARLGSGHGDDRLYFVTEVDNCAYDRIEPNVLEVFSLGVIEGGIISYEELAKLIVELLSDEYCMEEEDIKKIMIFIL
jgi:hypothetical protein